MKAGRVLDIGADPADEPDLRIRKRTAVFAALTFMVVAAVFGLVDLASGRLVFSVLALVQIVAFGTALASSSTHSSSPRRQNPRLPGSC